MELKVKVWIDHKERIVFGKGRASLLEAVAETGSISAAARRLGMSYRHAWTMLRTSEERLGRPLLVRNKGGRGGGGAQLTELAAALLRQYRTIEARFGGIAREATRAVRKLDGKRAKGNDRKDFRNQALSNNSS
jgi:molybdate transport system regulatory protein